MTKIQRPPSLEGLIKKQKTVLLEHTGGRSGPLVIMGTGYLGCELAGRLKDISSVEVRCFCDNNSAKQGTSCLGLPVLSVEEAVRRYSEDCVFVVGIFNGLSAARQLEGMGCKAIVTAATLCRYFGPPLIPLASIDYPTAIYSEWSEVLRCADLWADEKSRSEFAKVLNWFLSDKQEVISDHDPAAQTYFPDGLWTPSDEEHFVDCGAFNGDSVLFLLEQTGLKFRQVTAFEPDPRNFEAFKDNMGVLSKEQRQKIKVTNAAVGKEPGLLHFSVSGTAGSSVDAGGNFSIQCVSLDVELKDTKPTFLKMDIEGYELEALTGGRAILASDAPILAITTYHKVEHLWQIPLLIHSFQPGYQFYLRRYAEDCWETVCYAVPPNRQIKL